MSLKIQPYAAFSCQNASTVSTLEFSPNGKLLLSGQWGQSAVIRIWDLENKKELGPPLKTDNDIDSLAILQKNQNDWKLLSLGGDHKIYVWNVNQHKFQHTFKDNKGLGLQYFLQVSPNQKYIVSADKNFSVKLFTTNDFKEMDVSMIHECDVIQGAFSPNSNFLVTGDVCGNLKLWTLDLTQQKKLLITRKFSSLICSIDFSNNGEQLLISLSNGYNYVLDSRNFIRKYQKRIQTSTYQSFKNMKSIFYQKNGIKRIFVVSRSGYVRIINEKLERFQSQNLIGNQNPYATTIFNDYIAVGNHQCLHNIQVSKIINRTEEFTLILFPVLIFLLIIPIFAYVCWWKKKKIYKTYQKLNKIIHQEFIDQIIEKQPLKSP